jgi:hypothetical protein
MTPTEIVSTCTTPSSLQKAIEEALREAAEKAFVAGEDRGAYDTYGWSRNWPEPPDKSTYLSQYKQPFMDTVNKDLMDEVAKLNGENKVLKEEVQLLQNRIAELEQANKIAQIQNRRK